MEHLDIKNEVFLNSELPIEQLLGRMRACIATLDSANEQGKNVLSEYKDVEKLQTEISLLLEILKVKYKDYLKVEHEILFKFLPKLSRPFDVEYYEELTSQKAVLSHIPKDVSNEMEVERVAILNDNFTLIHDENICCTQIFDFLISYKYLEATTKKDCFMSFLRLQPPSKKGSMIWIDTLNGKATNRIICRLVTSLFSPKKDKYKQKNTSYMELIQCYFKPQAGEFNFNSLKVSLSQLESEQVVLSNQQEIRLDQKFREIHKLFKSK